MLYFPFNFFDALYKFMRIVGCNNNRSNKASLFLYQHTVAPQSIAKLKYGREFPKLYRRTLLDFPYISYLDCHDRNKPK